MASIDDATISQQRRRSSRSIKRKKFDDELVESSISHPRQGRSRTSLTSTSSGANSKNQENGSGKGGGGGGSGGINSITLCSNSESGGGEGVTGNVISDEKETSVTSNSDATTTIVDINATLTPTDVPQPPSSPPPLISPSISLPVVTPPTPPPSTTDSEVKDGNGSGLKLTIKKVSSSKSKTYSVKHKDTPKNNISGNNSNNNNNSNCSSDGCEKSPITNTVKQKDVSSVSGKIKNNNEGYEKPKILCDNHEQIPNNSGNSSEGYDKPKSCVKKRKVIKSEKNSLQTIKKSPNKELSDFSCINSSLPLESQVSYETSSAPNSSTTQLSPSSIKGDQTQSHSSSEKKQQDTQPQQDQEIQFQSETDSKKELHPQTELQSQSPSQPSEQLSSEHSQQEPQQPEIQQQELQEQQPQQSSSSQKPSNSGQQQASTSSTRVRRGRRKRRNFSDSSQEHFTRHSAELRPMKVRLVEKVSSLSPSVLFYEEANPIPNPVLPFWDARTIRDIHESDDVDELVNCICDLRKESGLMVQCECCLTWQHSSCLGIESAKDLPEVYICYICKNPRGVRESCRYKYDWSWLRNGILPSFPGCEEGSTNSPSVLGKSKILTANLLLNAALEVVNIIHSLRLKTQIFERKNVDLCLWSNSWVNNDSTKTFPSRDQERDQEINNTDFGPLKGNETDMLNDILDFSKNILEAVPSDQDKNEVPDDLKNELQEGTDLIDFIASSYGEINGIKEDEPMTDIQLTEETTKEKQQSDENLRVIERKDLDDVSNIKEDNGQLKEEEPMETMDLISSLQSEENKSKEQCPNDHNHADINNFTDSNPSLNDEDKNFRQALLDNTTSETPLNSAECAKDDGLIDSVNGSILEEGGLSIGDGGDEKEQPESSAMKSVSEDTETSEETEIEESNRSAEASSSHGMGPTNNTDEGPMALCRQNLIEHILDVQSRLVKRLDFIESKICELEKEFGLDPDPAKVEQDAFAFNNMIKDLYKDLQIVQRISHYTR